MTAEEFVRAFTQSSFLAVFLVVLVRAWRQPARANTLIASFFGIAASLVLIEWLQLLLGAGRFEQPLRFLDTLLILALPLALLSCASAFTRVPRWLLRGMWFPYPIAFLLLLAAPAWRGPLGAGLAFCFVALLACASVLFWRGSAKHRGLARTRLRLVSSGSVALSGIVLFGLPASRLPFTGLWTSLAILSGLVAGVIYFLGFAPPRFLRRSWQSSTVERFYAAASSVPLLTAGHLREIPRTSLSLIERHVADSLGVSSATIKLVHVNVEGAIEAVAGGDELTPAELNVYTSQQARLDISPSVGESSTDTILPITFLAPISFAANCFGILRVEGESALVFTDDDLSFTRTLADIIGLMLQTAQASREAAEAHTALVTVQLKQDFLDSVAHDLMTPLTTLVGQSQFMLRLRARGDDGPQVESGLRAIARESTRLHSLVRDLVDAASDGSLADRSSFQALDLFEVTSDALSDIPTPAGLELVGVATPVLGDRERLRQVIRQLLTNASKYGAGQGVMVRVGSSDQREWAYVDVIDNGIGIPRNEEKLLFSRFARATNTQNRRFTGLGVGLYLAKRIVDEHDGMISIVPSSDETIFRVALPLAVEGAG